MIWYPILGTSIIRYGNERTGEDKGAVRRDSVTGEWVAYTYEMLPPDKTLLGRFSNLEDAQSAVMNVKVQEIP